MAADEEKSEAEGFQKGLYLRLGRFSSGRSFALLRMTAGDLRFEIAKKRVLSAAICVICGQRVFVLWVFRFARDDGG
jgi:hypothetical protein